MFSSKKPIKDDWQGPKYVSEKILHLFTQWLTQELTDEQVEQPTD